jgi:hypothetical protein
MRHARLNERAPPKCLLHGRGNIRQFLPVRERRQSLRVGPAHLVQVDACLLHPRWVDGCGGDHLRDGVAGGVAAGFKEGAEDEEFLVLADLEFLFRRGLHYVDGEAGAGGSVIHLFEELVEFAFVDAVSMLLAGR